MTELNIEHLRLLTDHLDAFYSETQALRDQVQKSALAISTIEDGQVGQAIDGFLNATTQLIRASEALRSQLKMLTIGFGDYQGLTKDLANLGEKNDNCRRLFRLLWRSAIPLQIKAILDALGKTELELWTLRWGRAAPRALQISEDVTELRSSGVLRAEQSRALLTLRYAELPWSEIARVLDVSAPLALGRQSEVETGIVARLLEDWLNKQGDGDAVEAPVQVVIDDIRKSEYPGYGRNKRIVTLKRKDIVRNILIYIITPEDNERPLENIHSIDGIAFYAIGQDIFKIVAGNSKRNYTISQIFEAESENIWEDKPRKSKSQTGASLKTEGSNG